MPTTNQLIKHGRISAARKVKTTALRKSFNSIKRRMVATLSPQKAGVCLQVKTMTRETVKQTRSHCVHHGRRTQLGRTQHRFDSWRSRS
jgi:ribosomal protein S12